ncbi:hypothetical protein BD414DRAFT_482238 [Trametes punicea]|nr:hypothetical protein BD414DRAFT_482238 [Trametes punicea]
MSDIIVVVVTWQKTFKINWMSRDTPHGSKLHHVMFESGTVYFIILLCLNVLLILLNVFSLTNLSSIGYITIFIDPITSVLISHFILNLRSANEQLQASVSSSLISADLRFVGSPHLGDALAGPVHTYSIDELAADDSTIMPDDLLETQE